MVKIRKVVKLNRQGTVGASFTEEMKNAGFVAGAEIDFIPQPNGFLLCLRQKKIEEAAKPEPPLETL